MGKTTLKDIAQRVGVTEMTVSAALRNTGRISAAMRRQIIEMADKLGYRPNAAARSIRSGRFGCLALLVSREHPTPVTKPLLAGMEDAMRAKNLHLLLSCLPDEKLVDQDYMPQILRESMADGLLIKHDVNIPDAMVELIERHRIRIPALWLNSKHKGNCIYFDEFRSGTVATEHLIGLGHRRIAYYTHTDRRDAHYSIQDRFEGYCDAMRRAGLTPSWLDGPPGEAFERRARLEAILERLGGRERPTAVVAENETTARIVMLAAARLQLAPAADLSLITFSDAPFDDCGIPIDTMALPVAEMGSRSVNMLLQIIDDRALRLPPVKLLPRRLDGETCGPPKARARPVGPRRGRRAGAGTDAP